MPDAFGTLPKEWTQEQYDSFQEKFDAKMAGNLHRRRMMKFMPGDFKLIEYRQPPLKDAYDEWLARVICYAFSVPATPFVSQVNRTTSETMRLQATQEGLVPLKTWVKSALDRAIQVCMSEPDLEFVWVGDDAIDPLQQAQTLNILVSAGIKTREEARAELGLGGEGKNAAGTRAAGGLGKYNPHHNEEGRFTTADNAVEPGGQGRNRSRPKGVQVASNDTVLSDADSRRAGIDVAQIIEPEPPPEPPALPEPPEAPRPAEAPPSGRLLDAVAPDGKLPGIEEGVDARTMPASDDPNSTAENYIKAISKGQTSTRMVSKLDALGGYVIRLSDGAYITYRPAGAASKDTLPTTATVDINEAKTNRLNGGQPLKLKFPKK